VGRIAGLTTVLAQPNVVRPSRIRCSISEVNSLFHAGRHLRHRHQWLRHLIEQLASILLFSQRGHEELNHEPPAGNHAAGSVVFLKRSHCMATNQPRHGYERKRSQVQTKTMGQKHWTKRSRATGEFMDQKKAGKFKSVRREKGGG
jgi:hypothetical protein